MLRKSGHKVIAAALATGLAFSLVFTGCGSTPEEEDTEIIEDVVDVTDVDDTASYEDLLARIESSREQALYAGANNEYPLAFAAAEAEYEALKASGATGSEAMAALKDLNARYLAFETVCNAIEKKTCIDENDFASYNRADYDEATAGLNALDDSSVMLMSGAQFLKAAQKVDGKYDSVLNSAYRALSKEERIAAFEAKKLADSVKASVSRKAAYDQAVSHFKSGDQNFVTGNPEGAYAHYIASKDMFLDLYEEIYSARVMIQAKIDEAKLRVAESSDFAEAADLTNPLSGDEEGIEEEDVKLLEDDDFTAAEDNFVELEEDLSVEFSEEDGE